MPFDQRGPYLVQDRAVRFGFIGSIGVIGITMGTLWTLRISDSPAMPAGEAFITVLVGGMGVAVALTFLFGLIDLFVDEKLEVREDARSDE